MPNALAGEACITAVVAGDDADGGELDGYGGEETGEEEEPEIDACVDTETAGGRVRQRPAAAYKRPAAAAIGDGMAAAAEAMDEEEQDGDGGEDEGEEEELAHDELVEAAVCDDHEGDAGEKKVLRPLQLWLTHRVAGQSCADRHAEWRAMDKVAKNRYAEETKEQRQAV